MMPETISHIDGPADPVVAAGADNDTFDPLDADAVDGLCNRPEPEAGSDAPTRAGSPFVHNVSVACQIGHSNDRLDGHKPG